MHSKPTQLPLTKRRFYKKHGPLVCPPRIYGSRKAERDHNRWRSDKVSCVLSQCEINALEPLRPGRMTFLCCTQDTSASLCAGLQTSTASASEHQLAIKAIKVLANCTCWRRSSSGPNGRNSIPSKVLQPTFKLPGNSRLGMLHCPTVRYCSTWWFL